MAVTGNDLGDFVDKDKAFDPTDLSQWNMKGSGRTKLQILDDIYQAAEKKIINGIKQARVEAIKGRQRTKTLMQEKLENIEKNVNKKFALNVTTKLQDVVELQKKELVGQTHKINYEKMRGRFEVNINENLAMKTKIQAFSNDPVAYYLHKNRNFIRKLEKKRKKDNHMTRVNNFSQNIDDYFYTQRRDLYYAEQGVDPKN